MTLRVIMGRIERNGRAVSKSVSLPLTRTGMKG